MESNHDPFPAGRSGGNGSRAPLSPREMEALRLLAEGLSTEQITERMGVSRATARNHISHVLAKMGVQSRLQAVIRATEEKLLERAHSTGLTGIGHGRGVPSKADPRPT